MNSCGQFRDLFEAYALGALDAAEKSAFEAHLSTGCQDCNKAVEEARWVVSQLAYLAPAATPSDMLKGRLMQTVRAEAQASPKTAPAKSHVPLWMWGAVAASLLFAVFSLLQVHRAQKELRSEERQVASYISGIQELQAKLELAKRENVILTDAASVKIKLAEAGPLQPRVQAIWHAKLGIVLTAENVPAPAGNRVLQLWLIPKTPGGKPLPSEVVRPDAEGKFVLLVANPPEAMEGTKALAITEEPEGGSLAPTSTPRWVGPTI